MISKPKLAILPAVLLLTACCNSVSAQTPTDVVSVIRSSKLVDTKRDLTAAVRGYDVTISTFCDGRSGDSDCKITALLILKELIQHFKTIRQAHVSFYDDHDTSHYRTVVVQDKMVQLVDSGTPIKAILSTVPIASGNVPTAQTFSSNEIKPGPYLAERRRLAGAIQSVIDRGGHPDNSVALFARLQQACAAPRPNHNYVVQLNNAIVADLNQESKRVAAQQASRTPESHKPSVSQITDAVRQGINSSDSGDLDGILRNVESKVRATGAGR
ncbi:MAG TPA: hypothetical protein V6C69_17820 [Trichormus sp.]